MDSSKKYDNPSPEVSSNPVSRLFFCWLMPFFKHGYKNDLQIKDLYNPAKVDLSGPLGDELERNWEAEVKYAEGIKKRPSLMRAIRKTYFKSYAFTGVIIFIQAIGLRMILPIVLAMYIKYFETQRSTSVETGWILACSVLGLSFLNIILMHQASLGNQRVGMRLRIACCSLLYRKLLKLSRTSLGETATGQVINLMSNDASRFEMSLWFLHYIWIMPIQACVAGFILYNSVGLAALFGLGAITLQAVPLQGYLSRLQGKWRGHIAVKTDYRVKLMSEITSGIQVIKMYAWEKPFEKMVELARRNELNVLIKTSYIRAFSLALMVFTERTTLFIIVVAFVLMGNRITSDAVFSCSQLINSLQLYMCILYPLAVAFFSEAKVSIKRYEDFLLKEENTHIIKNKLAQNEKTGIVKLIDIKASWKPNPIVETLLNINIDIKPGMLCCIVGPVGSGKSSILQLLCRELPISSGKLDINGNISFASQEPWLFVSSVRNNILFGQPYLKNRYRDVVKVCALEQDFQQFPNGDKTAVGERGVSLSGGQRARINLARAVYREADIYLFDDPLSAVDTHVGKHLFEECIIKYLEKKTRILVTHQLQFLKRADLVVILNNGKVDRVCAYNELTNNDLNKLNQERQLSEDNDKTVHKSERPRLTSLTSVSSSGADDEDGEEPQENQELVQKGAISTSVYLDYYKSGANIGVLLFLVFLLIIAQAASNLSDLWLSHWTNVEDFRYNKTHNVPNSNTSDILENTNITKEFLKMESGSLVLDSLNQLIETNSTESSMTEITTISDLIITTLSPVLNETNTLLNSILNDSTNLLNTSALNNTNTEESEMFSQSTYMYIYSIFIIGSVVLTTLRSLMFFKICNNASRFLHNTMFNNVLQATMRFFDTNPSGRILNRFSKDMGTVDEQLPYATLQAVQIFLVMFGILIMVFIVTPWMVLPTIVLGVLFFICRVIYLSSAQDIKRLEGISKAPVFSHVSASLNGLATIRSSNAQDMIINEFDSLQDQNTAPCYLYIVASESFGFYLDIISIIFLSIVTLQFLIFDDGTTLAGNVGLVISQSMILTGMLQYGVRQTAEVASYMTSVERVLEYTKLDKEGPFETLPGNKPKRDWPSNGKVSFKNTYLSYIKDDPPVLKNLNIQLKPGEKIGIVGRTGAGKSTLIASLFRLAPMEGEIEIDDIDTSKIGLSDLRSKISIIPQEPILFSASVRYNLDPFGKADDETLWKALENVELKNTIESLDDKVSEGGSNFSAGQRQLVCLARAIVRNNKILVMDEATANVDPQTDALIQTTIREKFKNCTVLTVAHRLNTVMDSDRVLVMDAGQAVEFDHPHELLQNNDGYFTSMLKETGTALETKLKKIAEESYLKKIDTDKNTEP